VTINLSLFVTQVQNLVPDIPSEELSSINLEQQIKQAVRLYSIDLPDEITYDLTGDGGQYYAISSLTSWQDGFSNILSMQYPAPTVASDETPVYLDPEDWDADYYDGSTRYIYFPNHAPASTEAVRIRYSAPYTWAAGTPTTDVTQPAHGYAVSDEVYEDKKGVWQKDSTGLLSTHIITVKDTNTFTATELAANVPEMHFFSICHKAACLTCQAIAAKYSRTTDSTIGADSINHPSRAAEFRSRAMDFCQMYASALGLSNMMATGAEAQPEPGYAEFVDFDARPSWPGGRRFLFHGDDW